MDCLASTSQYSTDFPNLVNGCYYNAQNLDSSKEQSLFNYFHLQKLNKSKCFFYLRNLF